MEDGLTILSKIQKTMRENLQKIGDILISGGVDNMEKYQYMLGQARTYQIMLQEISNLLDNKEQKNEQGTVIDLNSRGPKA
jgi:hypothetical protein|tara:strand:+ start:40 stop:282 length:243 start_codon:yes stop_codon:yes gene_type:complete